jgi:hypothetical protein
MYDQFMQTINATSNEVASESKAFGAYVDSILMEVGINAEAELAVV